MNILRRSCMTVRQPLSRTMQRQCSTILEKDAVARSEFLADITDIAIIGTLSLGTAYFIGCSRKFRSYLVTGCYGMTLHSLLTRKYCTSNPGAQLLLIAGTSYTYYVLATYKGEIIHDDVTGADKYVASWGWKNLAKE